MSITYTWNFNPLDVTYESASLQNVVHNVHWQTTATTEATSSLGVSGSWTARNIGTQALVAADSASFSDYDSLTYDQIFGWVTESMGQEQYDSIITSLSSSLYNQLNPTTGKMNPPW
tara:strand:- start:3046 stop:3396 length:351 start_codon:yes stop_codon:yes gene_type:complete